MGAGSVGIVPVVAPCVPCLSLSGGGVLLLNGCCLPSVKKKCRIVYFVWICGLLRSVKVKLLTFLLRLCGGCFSPVYWLSFGCHTVCFGCHGEAAGHYQVVATSKRPNEM